LERRLSPKDDPVVMWLTNQIPTRWGPRDQAMQFMSKGEARRAAQVSGVKGAWSIEPHEPA
jgi:hypothetical protein